MVHLSLSAIATICYCQYTELKYEFVGTKWYIRYSEVSITFESVKAEVYCIVGRLFEAIGEMDPCTSKGISG